MYKHRSLLSVGLFRAFYWDKRQAKAANKTDGKTEGTPAEAQGQNKGAKGGAK